MLAVVTNSYDHRPSVRRTVHLDSCGAVGVRGFHDAHFVSGLRPFTISSS
jgi:hypothetical protein